MKRRSPRLSDSPDCGILNSQLVWGHIAMADDNSDRIDWIEPEVRELAVSETSVAPGRGGDGETMWVDCTLS